MENRHEKRRFEKKQDDTQSDSSHSDEKKRRKPGRSQAYIRSSFRGVYQQYGKWVVRGNAQYIGCFESEEDAARQYDLAFLRHNGVAFTKSRFGPGGPNGFLTAKDFETTGDGYTKCVDTKPKTSPTMLLRSEETRKARQVLNRSRSKKIVNKDREMTIVEVPANKVSKQKALLDSLVTIAALHRQVEQKTETNPNLSESGLEAKLISKSTPELQDSDETKPMDISSKTPSLSAIRVFPTSSPLNTPNASPNNGAKGISPRKRGFSEIESQSKQTEEKQIEGNQKSRSLKYIKSRFRGVYQQGGKWVARVNSLYIGSFESESIAARYYDLVYLHHNGVVATLKKFGSQGPNGCLDQYDMEAISVASKNSLNDLPDATSIERDQVSSLNLQQPLLSKLERSLAIATKLRGDNPLPSGNRCIQHSPILPSDSMSDLQCNENPSPEPSPRASPELCESTRAPIEFNVNSLTPLLDPKKEILCEEQKPGIVVLKKPTQMHAKPESLVQSWLSPLQSSSSRSSFTSTEGSSPEASLVVPKAAIFDIATALMALRGNESKTQNSSQPNFNESPCIF